MEKVKKLKRHKHRGLIKLIIIVLLLIVVYFLLFEVFLVKKIEVTGSERYSVEEIKEYIMKDRLDQNSLVLWMKNKYKEKPVIPFVEDINIKLLDRNTIEVKIYEKVVTGCVDFLGQYMYFDKDGIIVETTSEREENIPIIRGLTFNRIALYEPLKIQKESLFDTILNLTKLIRQYGLDVNSINFDSDFAVTLECGNSIVLLGKKDFYDFPLSQLGNILKAAEGESYTYDMSYYTEKNRKFRANKIE